MLVNELTYGRVGTEMENEIGAEAMRLKRIALLLVAGTLLATLLVLLLDIAISLLR
jgi:hypothetical protein